MGISRRWWAKKIFKVLKWHDSVATRYGTFKDVYEISEKTVDGEMTVDRFIYYAYEIGMILDENSSSETGTRSEMNVLKSYKIK
jgi:hypothetical protein